MPILQHDALGDLQREAGGVESGRGERHQHLVHETGFRQLLRSDVDRHPGSRRPVAHGGSGTTRLTQHPGAECDDLPRLLRYRHEPAGWQQPALRVLPAHERLEPAQVSALQVDRGLVVQHELLGLQGQVELRAEAEPVECLRVQGRVV
jgi:hypothetical protein